MITEEGGMFPPDADDLYFVHRACEKYALSLGDEIHLIIAPGYDPERLVAALAKYRPDVPSGRWRWACVPDREIWHAFMRLFRGDG
jgi:hypothetical protein